MASRCLPPTHGAAYQEVLDEQMACASFEMRQSSHVLSMLVLRWKVERAIWQEPGLWETMCLRGHKQKEFRRIPAEWSSVTKIRRAFHAFNTRPVMNTVWQAHHAELRLEMERPLKALDLAVEKSSFTTL